MMIQSMIHLTSFNLNNLVHIYILHDKFRDERSKTVQYLVIICHVNDFDRKRSRSMIYQVVEMQSLPLIPDRHMGI